MHESAMAFCQRLGVTTPIFQAPMAGPSTPELAAAVSRAGGLGFFAAGYLKPDKFRQNYQEAKELAQGAPIAVNFFAENKICRDVENESCYADELEKLADDLGINVTRDNLRFQEPPSFNEQLESVANFDLPVVTFVFGLPDRTLLEPLVARGTVVGATVTSVSEALAAVDWGADFLVVQGPEAGGHRAVFEDTKEVHRSATGLITLLPMVVDATELPVVAAGGVFDGRGIAACLLLGASAVQMGTAFLATTESGASPSWKQAILSSQPEGSVLTRAFSGRTARGLRNRTTDYFAEKPRPPLYPVANQISTPFRAAATRQSVTDGMSLWAGQGASKCRTGDAASILVSLWEDALRVSSRRDRGPTRTSSGE